MVAVALTFGCGASRSAPEDALATLADAPRCYWAHECPGYAVGSTIVCQDRVCVDICLGIEGGRACGVHPDNYYGPSCCRPEEQCCTRRQDQEECMLVDECPPLRDAGIDAGIEDAGAADAGK